MRLLSTISCRICGRVWITDMTLFVHAMNAQNEYIYYLFIYLSYAKRLQYLFDALYGGSTASVV